MRTSKTQDIVSLRFVGVWNEDHSFANWQKEAGPQTRKDDALGA
jgi:hypothetical protein